MPLRSFNATMKRLRHADVTMTLILSGVVIRGFPGGDFHVYLQTVENVFADDKLFVHYVQNYVARQQHVYLLQEVQTRYFCYLSIAWTAT